MIYVAFKCPNESQADIKAKLGNYGYGEDDVKIIELSEADEVLLNEKGIDTAILHPLGTEMELSSDVESDIELGKKIAKQLVDGIEEQGETLSLEEREIVRRIAGRFTT